LASRREVGQTVTHFCLGSVIFANLKNAKPEDHGND
jgi:hypothetical protein